MLIKEFLLKLHTDEIPEPDSDPNSEESQESIQYVYKKVKQKLPKFVKRFSSTYFKGIKKQKKKIAKKLHLKQKRINSANREKKHRLFVAFKNDHEKNKQVDNKTEKNQSEGQSQGEMMMKRRP